MKPEMWLAVGVFLLGCGSSSSSSPSDAESPLSDTGGHKGTGSGSGTDSGRGSGAGTGTDSGTGSGPDNDADVAHTATLTWDAPTTYSNGTPLTVAGYHVYYGTASRAYGLPVDAMTATSYVFSAPAPATYYFAVTAYDSSGSESQPSTEISKKIE